MKLKIVLQTIRPSFLILTPVCLFLGLSTSLTAGSPLNFPLFFLILTGAVSAHISVNMLNEYYDFKSGLDLKTTRTPFSGGSGALPDNPAMAEPVLIAAVVSLLIAIIIGIYLILIRGMLILPIGIVGLALIITYTQWLNRLPFLCLIAPGLGFGVLMVVGTHVILKGEHSQLAWLLALIPFFLINNLLLLNQYPDIKADASVGRNTFPIAFGLVTSNIVYALFILAAYSLILFYIIKGYIPKLSIIALIPMPFSIFALSGAVKYTANIGDYPQYMGANVVAAISTPLLLGISIINA
ncbi:MAG: prenyltransferase [Gammaproteobacteria bacterium]|nr:prenyltransferase [Gammaproteobacteria bacterium]